MKLGCLMNVKLSVLLVAGLHYLTFKVIYRGLKHTTAKPLYTVCGTVALEKVRKEMTGRTREISVVSGTRRVLELSDVTARGRLSQKRLSGTGNADSGQPCTSYH